MEIALLAAVVACLVMLVLILAAILSLTLIAACVYCRLRTTNIIVEYICDQLDEIAGIDPDDDDDDDDDTYDDIIGDGSDGGIAASNRIASLEPSMN